MGYIHSLESFGTVDGPGVRFVVFFQGCPMRCQYCHNPDTWNPEDGKEIQADEVIRRIERNRSYYKKGGITATGGEPLMQPEFLLELFTKAKQKGIHTCLDTSGIMFVENRESEAFKRIESIMQVTDLVMLDIKHIEDDAHKDLTAHSNANVLAFAKYLDEIGKPVWIRHVVVPNITYKEDELQKLGKFMKTLSNIQKLEVLPYHALGKVKYENLGMDYVLKDTPQLSKQQGKAAEIIIKRAWGQEVEEFQGQTLAELEKELEAQKQNTKGDSICRTC